MFKSCCPSREKEISPSDSIKVKLGDEGNQSQVRSKMFGLTGNGNGDQEGDHNICLLRESPFRILRVAEKGFS